MFRQFRNPISVLVVVFLCVIVVSIPSEGAVNNGVNAQSPVKNGVTTQAPVTNGVSTKAPVNNGVTTKTPTNNGAAKTKATTKASATSGGTPFDLQSMLAQLIPSSGGDAMKQAAQALDLLKFAFIGSPPEYTPSSECLDDVTEMLKGVLSGQMWALKSKC